MKHLALLLLPLLSLTSCALNAPVEHATDLSGYKTFYVPAQAGDGLGLSEVISSQLNAMSFTSTTGASAKPATAVDGIVTFRTEPLPGNAAHLQKLVLHVRDPKTGKLVAASRSDQEPSLMPASNKVMVEKALHNILAATPVREGGGARGSLMERETLLW